MISVPSVFSCTGTATSAIHTLSLHDALPIFARSDTYSHSGSPCVGTLGRQTQNWAFRIQARAVKKSPDNRMGFPSILAFFGTPLILATFREWESESVPGRRSACRREGRSQRQNLEPGACYDLAH